MGFRMFSNPAMPIAINFGSTSVKLLQLATGERSQLQAAAELALPSSVHENTDELFETYDRELPKLIREGRFKGKRVVCSVPTHQTIIQHMQLPVQEGVKREDLVKSQLQIQMGIAPGSAVIRSIDVAELNRAGQNRAEVICFAIPRDVVMRYVAMLARHKLEVIGVHAEAMAMVHAFDHIHQRQGDENITTMYIDLGYAGTRVAIAHGTKIVFARAIQVGGFHFDQHIAKQLDCDLTDATAHRLAMNPQPLQRTNPTPPPTTPNGDENNSMAMLNAAMARENATENKPQQHEAGVTVVAGERREGKAPAAIATSVEPADASNSTQGHIDLSELLDTISDEISMCLRYHNGLFPSRSIDRAILVGGEARQRWLCQHVVRALRLPAQLGDPLAAMTSQDENLYTPGLDRTQPQPGWTVACGLAATPING